MPDQVPYREPDLKEDAAERARRETRHAVRSGAIVFVISMMALFLPLALGRNDFNKYIVAFALVGAFAGMSFMLHGAVDAFRGRKR